MIRKPKRRKKTFSKHEESEELRIHKYYLKQILTMKLVDTLKVKKLEGCINFMNDFFNDKEEDLYSLQLKQCIDAANKIIVSIDNYKKEIKHLEKSLRFCS